LNQFAFEPRDYQARNTLTGQPRYCLGEDECYFRASIELPSGSILRRLQLDAYDVASDPPGNVYVWLWRCTSVPWSCTTLTIFQTQGAPGMQRVTDDLVPPETIDNATYTYLVTAAATSGTSDTRFAGLRLIFDPPASRQNPEWLTINAYGFEVYSRDEEEAITDYGLRRYCYDSDCDLVAPVELPSGSKVTTLMMDVGDAGSGTVETWFHRCPSGQGGCIPLAYQDTVGMPGDTQLFVNLPVPEIIDNDANSYVVAAHLTGGTFDPLLGSVRLLYAPPGIFADGFESGDTASWSTSVP